MQSFRVREFVRAGTPDDGRRVARHVARSAASSCSTSLGLPAKSDVASDPFFGRGGKMLADGQKEQKLKFEVLVPVISRGEADRGAARSTTTRSTSATSFDIRTADGEVAHTACLGFGLERVVMALFKTHGFDPDELAAARCARRLWP